METTIKEKNILLVDDEIDILKLLGTVLNKEGFKNVYKAETGNEAINIFKNNDIDIVVLDIMLPDKEGYEVFKEIRQISQVPVLFLSAKTEEMDRVLGLALGADDYITKPFSPKEVALRIKLNLKKNLMLETKKDEDTKEKLVFGPFEIDEDSVEVKKNGKTIELKAKEFKMFLYMAKHLEQIISKEKFCDEVWGDDFIGYDNTIMVHIRRLREKIEDNPSKPKHIKNIKGLGYKLTLKEN
ncbi:two-component system signal transduction response regulator [[Clostridium] sordellii]|uniref:Stage 0 sporulation protein A homolog n=1 Tax=Paraclostridium sordellii TaxID=1505 RepID=A0ABM9RQR0_PARSO|nr:response regulator transcription factor [Paeniclostridium sordellii]CEJ74402.1 Two-component response regulator [[Clostridium] sordellii] [Paeniclostridium sordellii]CEN69942.1 two-component system signal transduction response regulator [[Clostridium] sordellii] [Paeniclostridium sordellii]CEN73265.1 two-component system signal transduction response regulator [[Clostridium] sordellii] [Paeniclostridium sordellii]CEO29568.1 two-component system signal transduction response regulator [[Clostri